MSRKIQAPGIELNEIDRSGYQTKAAADGTVCLVLGFADKGPDYNVKYIDSMNTYEYVYGVPKTEAERYLYNAAYEVIRKNGVLTVGKIPYDNETYNKYSYTKYQVGKERKVISSFTDITEFRPKENINLRQLISFSSNEMSCLPSLICNQQEYIRCEFSNDLIKYFQDNFSIKSEDTQAFGDMFNNGLSVISLERMMNLFSDDRSALCSKFPQYSSNIQSIGEDAIDVFQTYDGMVSGFITTSNIQDISAYYDYSRYFADKLLQNGTYIECEHTDQAIVADGDRELPFLTEQSTVSSKYLDDKLPLSSVSSLFIMKYYEVKQSSTNVETYVQISSIDGSGLMDQSVVDSYLIKTQKVKENEIVVVDKLRKKYLKDSLGKEYCGTVVVITTPMNAMYYQGIVGRTYETLSDYTSVSSIHNVAGCETARLEGLNMETFGIDGFTIPIGSEHNVDQYTYTLSEMASEKFPNMPFKGNVLDNKNLGNIGVVVFMMYKDNANEGKMGFKPVESFVGSLDRNYRDNITGQNVFIDDIVNEGSKYIYLFSNVPYMDSDGRKTEIAKASTLLIRNQSATSLGFYDIQTKKSINIDASSKTRPNIYESMQKIFDSVQDYNVLDIDIICDAGLTNIAQFIRKTGLNVYDLTETSASRFTLKGKNDTQEWRTVAGVVDDFVRHYRKDCVFIMDGLRNFCLEGNEKIVRNTRPQNTVKNSILPNLRYITEPINSSYAAGYLNWFKCIDAYSGRYFWSPPSIKTMGVYLNTDVNYHFWDAPAGLNRGILTDVVDTAFTPSFEDSEKIYDTSWNYAVNYPMNGIAVEGQRTFQTNKTALDRMNVRRLMLGLEKSVRNYMKYFVYENNTAYNRQNVQDNISRYLGTVQSAGGINQYMVICDDRNNTSDTIDNNELHIQIYVKPVKSIEFVVLNFVCTSQGQDVVEMSISDLG